MRDILDVMKDWGCGSDPDNRFRYFAKDEPVVFPEGFVGAPLEIKTATELMTERKNRSPKSTDPDYVTHLEGCVRGLRKKLSRLEKGLRNASALHGDEWIQELLTEFPKS